MESILISLNGEHDLDLSDFILRKGINYIVGVDGGIHHMVSAGVKKIDLGIGDFDSFDLQKYEVNIEELSVLNKEKDETDFQVALSQVREKFPSDSIKIYVVGYRGSKRIEHFYSNLLILSQNIDMEFHDRNEILRCYLPGNYSASDFPKKEFLSFFAVEDVDDLVIKGLQYEYAGWLSRFDNRCISNEWPDDSKINKIEMKFSSGVILMIASDDD